MPKVYINHGNPQSPRVDSATEHTISIQELIDDVIAAKFDSPDIPPLNISYQARHFSALIRSGISGQLPDCDCCPTVIRRWTQVLLKPWNHACLSTTMTQLNKKVHCFSCYKRSSTSHLQLMETKIWTVIR
uniref:Uncharacterized protein n=1 Tax=Hyaloperonospora arabidopsidis (strain Emoy2) TaxID=559515 RepID=M4B9M5_HYAAE